jgi:hypothetical protein
MLGTWRRTTGKDRKHYLFPQDGKHGTIVAVYEEITIEDDEENLMTPEPKQTKKEKKASNDTKDERDSTDSDSDSEKSEETNTHRVRLLDPVVFKDPSKWDQLESDAHLMAAEQYFQRTYGETGTTRSEGHMIQVMISTVCCLQEFVVNYPDAVKDSSIKKAALHLLGQLFVQEQRHHMFHQEKRVDGQRLRELSEQYHGDTKLTAREAKALTKAKATDRRQPYFRPRKEK